MAGGTSFPLGATGPRLRLATGLVLMAFVTGHLVNACLGLVSIAAMEQGRAILLKPWQTLPGQVLLYGSPRPASGPRAGHAAASRRADADSGRPGADRRRARWCPFCSSPTSWRRGLPAPWRISTPDYGWILSIYWRWAPDYGLQQVLLVAVVWVHGCIGLLAWLRLQAVVAARRGLHLSAGLRAADRRAVRLRPWRRRGPDAARRVMPTFKAEVLAQSRSGYTVLPDILTWQHGLLAAYVAVACPGRPRADDFAPPARPAVPPRDRDARLCRRADCRDADRNDAARRQSPSCHPAFRRLLRPCALRYLPGQDRRPDAARRPSRPATRRSSSAIFMPSR